MTAVRYWIVPYPPSDEQYAAAVEGPETVRTSLDGAQCVLKARGVPAVFDGFTSFSHSEVLTLMHGSGWLDDNSPEVPDGG